MDHTSKIEVLICSILARYLLSYSRMGRKRYRFTTTGAIDENGKVVNISKVSKHKPDENIPNPSQSRAPPIPLRNSPVTENEITANEEMVVDNEYFDNEEEDRLTLVEATISTEDRMYFAIEEQHDEQYEEVVSEKKVAVYANSVFTEPQWFQQIVGDSIHSKIQCWIISDMKVVVNDDCIYYLPLQYNII